MRKWLRTWLGVGSEQPSDDNLPLAAQVAVLRTQFQEISQQWTDLQDWLARQVARENARKRRAIKASMDPEGGDQTPAQAEILDPGASQGHPMSRKAYLRSLVTNGRGR